LHKENESKDLLTYEAQKYIMEIKLSSKPKNVIIIEGFPGLGLIGTISTEYLIKHLKAKPIGEIISENVQPMVAVHSGHVVQPLEIYYVKEKNLVIVHALTDIRGLEYELSAALLELYKILQAKEIISLEGILGQSKEMNAYYYCNHALAQKKFTKAQASPLKEGIVMGVTAALLMKGRKLNTTGIFVETHSKLPDSRSAAKVIELLDIYLDLKVDYKPLEEAAQEFEKKLKGYVEGMQEVAKKTDKKAVNYLG
jgi:uncharacterized protein